MQYADTLPDVVTSAYVPNVQSHRGLVEEGLALIVDMSTKYEMRLSLQCHTCMANFFGHAKHLRKIERLTQDMLSSNYFIIGILPWVLAGGNGEMSM